MRDLALNNIYGTKIVDFVKKVTKIDYEERLYVMSNNESFSKIIEENVVPFCIKLADRMHNILTIDSHKDQKKRIKIARETLDFFILLCEKFEIKIFKEKIKNASQYILENGKIEGFRK
jgi:GTP pyrophosphokinase